jgi:DNA repair protein RadA/Sms
MGFCPQCRAAGSLREVGGDHGDALVAKPLGEIAVAAVERTPAAIGEVDRVLGGGFVPGSVILVGGEPGVGKSTLALQIAHRVAADRPVLYASAEESTTQVAIRARRLGLGGAGLRVAAGGDTGAILATAAGLEAAVIVVDSIQTVTTDAADGTAGGVVQVRESAARFIDYAKQRNTVVILVGHVTKDGSIAGPRTLEHMVDVVLYLEGEGDAGLRLLRSLKNRFGSVNQVGVFSMEDDGLAEVVDPSSVLVAAHRSGAAGTVLFPAVEGRRALLCEVQALVVPSTLPQPRRSVKGVDSSRIHQILAVLERHGGFSLGKSDVHVNIAGGLRLRDPAVDLPVALAIVSSLADRPLPFAAAWGELGLTGEVRVTAHEDRRLAEATRFDPPMVIRPGNSGVLSIAEALLAAGLASTIGNVARLRGS